MREYLLYVKVGREPVQAYVTPCFRVDQDYWQEQEGSQLYVIGRTPSLAMAFSLRERLNQYLQERQAIQGTVNEQALAGIRRIALTTVREASAVYGTTLSHENTEEKEWFAWSEAKSVKEENSTPIVTSGDKEQSVKDVLAGRALLWEEMERLLQTHGIAVPELPQLLQRMVLSGDAQWLPGVRLHVRKSWLRHSLQLACARCGSGKEKIELTTCHSCGQGCAYCTECLGMGRSKCCTPFLCVPAHTVPSSHAGQAGRLVWSGRYSRDQEVAADRARQFVSSHWRRNAEFLIWAVCGAGKTELLFPSVVAALEQGERVLIATPRKDVVLELAPRIQRVFPEARVIAVHGSSKEKWEECDIAIATTHQVMRFYQRFFLVVLDEVDAFPYHQNPVLYRAVARAVKTGGRLLYLSATPPRYLQKRLVTKQKSLLGRSSYALYSSSHVLLPGRYHGHALPVPQICTVSGLDKLLAAGRVITPLHDMLKASLDAGRQVFVFVPRVEEVPRMLGYLQAVLPEYRDGVAGVHASDPAREEKVMAFREKAVKLMVTTTILERGVTIPGSDVAVVGAQAPVFDEASLVQIAGRVGRSPDDPQGTVLFVQSYRASAPQAAVRQITQMNQLAKQLRDRRKMA
ncbi:DEAD/DEAH box helicase [Brevibacillus panacihumi]|uniref:DEAD/DEAH box helicase n=1 Tax=Brevibacillus panacihumi TaxID=497735 RepID=A0A3M8DB28_9BACL|nr:DEAD/DEAH box helicase [Brevibacillus panacihumi]RNB85206.1 DEAD/DEAH box helicase [Brevibacillus panacihumi]